MIEDSGRTGGRFGHRGTAFYIEALLLAGALAMVVLMLTRVFVRSGQLGKDAALLTDAVHLAENGAEAVAASRNLEEVRELLEENGNAEILADGPRILRIYYDADLNPGPDGVIWMDIQWVPEVSEEPADSALGEDGLVKSIITVNRAGRTEPVYRLETEVFTGLD